MDNLVQSEKTADSADTELSGAYAVGLATITEDQTVLDTWFPKPKLLAKTESSGSQQLSAEEAVLHLGESARGLLGKDAERGVNIVAVSTTISDLAEAPIDAHDVYLRLHLLSHRLVRPNEQNLTGIFGLLSNVVWTNFGPCPVDHFEETRFRLRSRGPVTVYGIDKFPRMLDYVTPTGVRIADADRVRLGAYLASGTTVMHEGFVNFNAGTLGASMVEGRISAGVAVGDGSDIGGGASIMGTLSGGGKEVISLGERCLIGANGGVGISLGDDSVVEAGLYVTAGTKVNFNGKTVKARDLSGISGVVFRRNSVQGTVEAVPRNGVGIELNAVLHAND